MIDTILAFDEKDEHMGAFFNSCFNDFDEYFIKKQIQIKSLKSDSLNELSVQLSTQQLNKFIFVAYSHGTDEILLKNGITPYISTTINIENFKNSFFYTCSCDTGKRLGEKLIEKGCVTFIGYNDKFVIWDYNRKPFVECANFGLKLFFEGNNTEEIIIKMKEKYTYHIDNYKNDFIGAAMLLSNRKALIPIGQNITINNILDV